MKNFFKKRNVKVVTNMVAGTIIYCLAIVWILDLGKFYAGGVTGVSQLIVNMLNKLGYTVSISIFIALFNIPLFVIGWRGVSRRFAYLSLISIILQVVFIFILEQLSNRGINPFKSLAEQKLLLAMLGGLLTGTGCGIILRGGASSGGMDILSQYISLKRNISFAKISLAVDFIIICLGGIFAQDIAVAVYTIVRLLIHIIALDKIHTIYKFMKISIVTTKRDEMREALITHFNHGVTIYHAIGAYTNQDRWVFESVILSYETEEYSNIAKTVDSKVFITFESVNSIIGFFNRNVIA